MCFPFSPADSQQQDIRNVLNLGDYFGHTGHLSNLVPKKPDYTSRATNPREIEAILQDAHVRTVDTTSTAKLKAVPLAVKHVSYHLNYVYLVIITIMIIY